jgi:hypothetical protein
MKLGVYSASDMRSDLQTNLNSPLVDTEIMVKEPRLSWYE